MPPLLALALCSAFVIFLLRLDRKQSPDVTLALWIPTIWMLYIGSRPLGIWFQAQSTNPEAGSLMDRIFLTALMFFALAIIIRRQVDWVRVLRENAWLTALLAFMLLSVIWSNIPLTSLKRWIREFQAILMALIVLSEPSPRQALESILRRMTYILIPFSLILIKYFPYYGVEYGRWSGEQYWLGVSQQKNGLAGVCIVSGTYLIWSLMRRRRQASPPGWRYQTHTDVLIMLLTFYLFGGPRHNLFYSATSTYALMAGLIVGAWIYLRGKSGKQVKAGLLLAIVVLVIVLGVTSVLVGGSSIKFFATSAGRDSTLTGRLDVWASLLPSFKKHPLMGGGFGSFWTSRTRDYFNISGAHSGYLDVLLGIGFAGLILTSLFLLSCCQKAHREVSMDFRWGLLWMCYLMMSVVHNIAESSIDTFTSLLTAVLLFFTVCSMTTSPTTAEAFEAEASTP